MGKKQHKSGKTVLVIREIPALVDLANNTQNSTGYPFICNFTAIQVFSMLSKEKKKWGKGFRCFAVHKPHLT